MTRNKIHFQIRSKYTIGKQIGKQGLCGAVWIDATKNIDEVTCKKCLKEYTSCRVLSHSKLLYNREKDETREDEYADKGINQLINLVKAQKEKIVQLEVLLSEKNREAIVLLAP